MDDLYLKQLGKLVRDARKRRDLTQEQLAEALSTSQSAIARIEQGQQNLSLEMISRIGAVLETGLVELAPKVGPTHLRVEGGHPLSGSIEVKSSKNAAVALLCASLLNDGSTILRGIARIEEVNRIIEVLKSIGVTVSWIGDSDLKLQPPAFLKLDSLDVDAARRTRSVLLLLGSLMHKASAFALPYAGGCKLGTRTVEPHKSVLRAFGMNISATEGNYQVTRDRGVAPTRPIVLIERGDTVTENALMAAARIDQITVIRNASSNYMVQDLCFYLDKLGVRVEGIGSTTLTVHGRSQINVDVEYWPSEDPIEAMSLLTAAIVTGSEIEVTRVPIEFLEIELAILGEMGFRHHRTEEYAGTNGRTRLVDIRTLPSALHAPIDKVHPMPFPGLNIDNIPFFAVIAAVATGRTLIHDWVFENRAIYLTELNRLGAQVTLLDPHRIWVDGPTHWSGAEVICPPALRPAVVLLLAMLAAKGTSVLRHVYVIDRGYEDLAVRLSALGARIESFSDI
ncbi:MAG TPA: UDP-N-acetylglucosamine 1-carboxyvinyltransferase [Candidatus Nanopelagicaceae bacterium]|nr:UDP-N-acetylglucosamine 1-carboxyvinyltransferase [Candidatus Nanopelagicaceae bacterium]